VNRLLRALVLIAGVAGWVKASPVSSPAGNFITNVSTNVSSQIFSVSSGTVSTWLNLPYITPGQCTTVSASGKVIGTACGSGSANVAVTTGSISGFRSITSSPTTVVNFDSSTFSASLTGASTVFVSLSNSYLTTSSATATYIQQSSATATYLLASSATATYLQSSSATATYFQKTAIIPVANGGTGTSSPGLIAGTNIGSITGTWPNNTINASSSLVTSTASVTAGHCAQFSAATGIVDAGAACGSAGSPNASVQFNNNGIFGGSSNFQWFGSSMQVTGITVSSGNLNVMSSNALSLYNSKNTGFSYFQNPSTNQSQLNIIAADGIGINNSPSSSTDLLISAGTGRTYGSFAVVGSSNDSSGTYSGFTSTGPVSQSVLWSLPKSDGINTQAITTDGSGHLSFGGPLTATTITATTSASITGKNGLSATYNVYAATASFGDSGFSSVFPNGDGGGRLAVNIYKNFGAGYAGGSTGGLFVQLKGALSLGTASYGFTSNNNSSGKPAYAGYFYSDGVNSGSTNYGLYSSATAGLNNYGLFVANGQVQINSSMTVTGAGGISNTYGITTGSATITSILQIPSQTISQLHALTGLSAGQEFYCSDCTTDGVVISTGTGTGAIGRVGAKSTFPN